MKKEKVVGILGGMGPFATVDFFRQIVEHTHAKKDWEHLRILIDNNVKIPSRTRAVLYNEESPVPGMIDSINGLAFIGADFAVLPCNSAHYFYDEVVPNIKIPWLNIIEITSNKIKANSRLRPLILGGHVTTNFRLYSKFIPNAVYLEDDENRTIESMIEEIKLTSTLSDGSKNKLKTILMEMKKSIDCVVLACTEFPIVFNDEELYGVNVINSSLEYVKKIIEFAKAKSK